MNIPTQAEIDKAREDLEHCNFKLGKARARSIMSTAQASVDAQDLQACIDRASKAESDFAGLTERFLTPQAEAPRPVAAPVIDAGRDQHDEALFGDESRANGVEAAG